MGEFFTWSNRRDEDPIQKKLDRVLVNAEWEGTFPGFEARFLPAGVSDPAASADCLAPFIFGTRALDQ